MIIDNLEGTVSFLNVFTLIILDVYNDIRKLLQTTHCMHGAIYGKKC